MVDHSSITLLSLQDHGWPPPKYTAGIPIMKQHANVLTWWQGRGLQVFRRFETLEKTNSGSRHFVGHIIWWDDLGNLRSWDSWDMMKISTKQISTGVYVLFGRTAFSFHTHLRGFGECFKDWGPISHTKHFKYGWCTKPLKRKGVKL